MPIHIDSHTRLFDIADRQAGYFTAAQAQEAGYSYSLQSYHRRQGRWLDEGWGIYRLRNYPTMPNEELVRLMLWSRNRDGEVQAVVSHDTALRVYELSDIMPAKIHLNVPKGFRKPPSKGVVLHKTKLSEAEVGMRDGYRITTPLQTLLDVADSPLSPEHLGVAVREALERGLVRRAKLKETIAGAPDQVRERFAYVGLG